MHMSTTIRTENLDTLASKGDIQELTITIARIEEIMGRIEEMSSGRKTNHFLMWNLLPIAWKFLPIAHTLLHIVTILLVGGII